MNHKYEKNEYLLKSSQGFLLLHSVLVSIKNNNKLNTNQPSTKHFQTPVSCEGYHHWQFGINQNLRGAMNGHLITQIIIPIRPKKANYPNLDQCTVQIEFWDSHLSHLPNSDFCKIKKISILDNQNLRGVMIGHLRTQIIVFIRSKKANCPNLA